MGKQNVANEPQERRNLAGDLRKLDISTIENQVLQVHFPERIFGTVIDALYGMNIQGHRKQAAGVGG